MMDDIPAEWSGFKNRADTYLRVDHQTGDRSRAADPAHEQIDCSIQLSCATARRPCEQLLEFHNFMLISNIDQAGMPGVQE